MTLLECILKKVQSHESVHHNNSEHLCLSPPPDFECILDKRKRKYVDKFPHVKCKVDTSPPVYTLANRYRNLERKSLRDQNIYYENVQIITMLRRAMTVGKVDSRWREMPKNVVNQRLGTRINFLKKTEVDNLFLYRLIRTAKPKVETTKLLLRDDAHRRRQSRLPALGEYLVPKWAVPASHFTRPRAWLRLGIEDGSSIGCLQVELFTDVVPATCNLFTTLLAGDGVGFGYVGTSFFRKVPGLYWRGGDVVYDVGFGCYAERGRTAPIPAENFHFPHSEPGLLSMHVTIDNETCCTFNITFKPLPQFDLRNVVFGRVIQPSDAFDAMRHLGSPLSPHPKIIIQASRVFVEGQWVYGVKNTRLVNLKPKRVPRPKH